MVDIYNQFKDFKAFEVVFLDENNSPRKLFCSVKSIETTTIIIDANNAENNNNIAKVGAELKLHIYTENGIYSATSKVVSAQKGLVNTEYEIAYPTDSKHSQRREYFRADLAVEYKMNVIIDAESGENLALEGKTRNICGKGMSVLANTDIDDYSEITVQLFFNERSISTKAKLVYSRELVLDVKHKYVLAFAFTTIDSKDIDYIVKQCFLHQLELRRKQKD